MGKKSPQSNAVIRYVFQPVKWLFNQCFKIWKPHLPRQYQVLWRSDSFIVNYQAHCYNWQEWWPVQHICGVFVNCVSFDLLSTISLFEELPDWLSYTDHVPVWNDILLQGKVAVVVPLILVLNEIPVFKQKLSVWDFLRVRIVLKHSVNA